MHRVRYTCACFVWLFVYVCSGFTDKLVEKCAKGNQVLHIDKQAVDGCYHSSRGIASQVHRRQALSINPHRLVTAHSLYARKGELWWFVCLYDVPPRFMREVHERGS